MVAWKVFLTVGILAVVVAGGVLYFVPDYRPKIVNRWILGARGFGPAKTPEEALAKFKKAIKARDYEAASNFCTADYAEQMRKCAKQAHELGKSIDGLAHAIQNVTKVETPAGLYVLSLLEPFPPDFTYKVEASEGAEAVNVRIVLADAKLGAVANESELKTPANLRLDRRIQRTLLPRTQDVARALVLREVAMDVQVKAEGDKEKTWKIDFPVTSANQQADYPGMRESVDFMEKKGGSYAEALDNLKDSLKRDAEAKSTHGFESELRRELNEVDASKGN